jgi:hypothetical protein
MTYQNDKMETIYETLLPYMAENDIEDTTENRISALQGLRDAWMEDDDRPLEAHVWIMAVNMELVHLALQRLKEHLAP